MGAKLLMMVQLFELTEQVRTRDEVHTELVTHIYNGGTIDPNVIKQNYKIISQDDFKCSNSPWIDAPVIVPSNREHSSITDMAACRFARAHNTVVIWWLSKQSEWIQKLECSHCRVPRSSLLGVFCCWSKGLHY